MTDESQVPDGWQPLETSYRIDATAELVELVSELAEVLFIVAAATGNEKAMGYAERAAKRAHTLMEDFDGQTR